jgi:dsDNA-specific endonuclease/ATPase MutS2
MDEQAIRNDVLEAESIIRGLAQRMQDASAALLAAETARQGMVDARTALHGASAQLDNLHRFAGESLRRVEEASKNLVDQAGQTLQAATSEMGRNARQMIETRGELIAAARAAQQAAKDVLERDNEALADLQALASTLPARVAETASGSMQPLLDEIRKNRASSEAVYTHLENIREELHGSLERNAAAEKALLESLQKQASFLEETAAFLTERMQEARNDASSHFSDLETTLLQRIDSCESKATWGIVLQLLMIIALGASAFFAARTVLHF